jgi:hypothetical protein
MDGLSNEKYMVKTLAMWGRMLKVRWEEEQKQKREMDTSRIDGKKTRSI